MRIKKITLNNFRIYRGENSINFKDEETKNIHLITGENGFGKTTFLSSLIWCLYGNGMQDVEDVYRKYISESGGYKNFLADSINKLAKAAGEKTYFVEITLEGVDIPGIQIDNVIIRRNVDGSKERLEILIDGDENELVAEIGKELFIQDFILPKEIAKFFFFDAEKITSLAELKSVEDKRKLSRAYSEVLGIKKYEDLKSNLLDIKYKYRKDGATDEDRNKLEKIELTVSLNNKRLIDIEKEKKTLSESKLSLMLDSDTLQEKLIRIGTSLTANQLDVLRKDKVRLSNESKDIKARLAESLEMAPFAIMANEFQKTLIKAKQETNKNNTPETVNFFKNKITTSIDNLFADKKFLNEFGVKQSKHFSDQLKKQILNDFTPESQTQARKVIDFENKQLNGFEDLFLKIKLQYKINFENLLKNFKVNRSDYSNNKKALMSAESKENDRGVLQLRNEKLKLTEKISEIDLQMERLIIEGALLLKDVTSLNRVKSELENKLGVGAQFKNKNEITERLITKLEELIVRIKEEKKSTLEKRIKETLNLLMHKKNFVNRVEVLISNDLIDIDLFDSTNQLIEKKDLSKGEQQLYATSILKALVDESNIQFPVFVDSPLQKFDVKHARNVINDFYPYISKQVIIIPLLEKELNEREYNLLKKNICDVWLIENRNDQSVFVKLKKSELFERELVNA